MRVFLCLAIALSASASRADQPADSQDAPAEQTNEDQNGRTPAPERRVLIYRVKHMPAEDLAESLGRLFAREQNVDVVMIPEPIGNQLLISGTPKALSPVKEILEQVDRPRCQIQLELLILHEGEEIGYDLSPKQVVEMIRSQRETDHSVVESLDLTAVGNHLVTVELGERQPTIIGSQSSKSGRSNTLQMEDIGTIIRLEAASSDRQNISETKIVRATRDATNRLVMAITASVVLEKHE